MSIQGSKLKQLEEVRVVGIDDVDVVAVIDVVAAGVVKHVSFSF